MTKGERERWHREAESLDEDEDLLELKPKEVLWLLDRADEAERLRAELDAIRAEALRRFADVQARSIDAAPGE
jgi:hypothetical protein